MQALRRHAFLPLVLLAAASPAARAEEAVDYLTQVKPILSARCYGCHSALRQQGSLRVDTAALLRTGGDSGESFDPGDGAGSLLVAMLTGESGSRMPPEDDGPALRDDQIALIAKWIDQGAAAPDEPTPPDPREHWAYVPPVRAATPPVERADRVRNPIDAFLAVEHEARGLIPAPEADRDVLLRRVYLDLTGVPPTRNEREAFLADESPDAYEQVVDRLLASPQYGQRWGRHWMDVWRYSDWSGYQAEIRNSARHIWRWRDWIVESLNEDKPYDRMVMEMLAGDELAPTNPRTLRATGYLVRNWYKFNRSVWLDATIEHTAKAFLGVTMNCCRCHDHKYDPISQRDYFRLRAVFEPHDVRTDRVPGESDLAKDGLPRVVDAKPDEATYVFERGEENRPLKDAPVGPGIPELFGVELAAEPVELPVTSYYPPLAEFTVEEDLARSLGNVVAQEAAARKAKPESAALAAATLATARAAHASLSARIAADKAKYGVTPDADTTALAKAAAQAERDLALCQAQGAALAAWQELEQARAALKPEDAALVKAVADAEAKHAAAAEAVEAAYAAVAVESSEYAPLGAEYPKTSTGRRLALARWIADRRNPLTARVAVNHIWLRHFGAPLAGATFDFGLRTPAPPHQPLLDWLAVELMEGGWRMKPIHRLIVTSAAYRMSSAAGGGDAPAHSAASGLALDPDNKFLWRMNSRRLEAEAARDSILHVAGNLDESLGGPDIPHAEGLKNPRRSIYFRHAYEKQMGFLATFDGASVNECYERGESVVPQQALAMANSELSLNQSRLLAGKLGDLAGERPDQPDAFVKFAFEQILSREPTAEEVAHCRDFLAAQVVALSEPQSLTPFTGGTDPAVPPSADPAARARENLVHVLLNHNDFITIR
jgi:hypothetical protein